MQYTNFAMQKHKTGGKSASQAPDWVKSQQAPDCYDRTAIPAALCFRRHRVTYVTPLSRVHWHSDKLSCRTLTRVWRVGVINFRLPESRQGKPASGKPASGSNPTSTSIENNSQDQFYYDWKPSATLIFITIENLSQGYRDELATHIYSIYWYHNIQYTDIYKVSNHSATNDWRLFCLYRSL